MKLRKRLESIQGKGRVGVVRGLGDERVRGIKRDLIEGMTVSMVARREGVSGETISRIRRGLTYQHVEVEGEEGLRVPMVGEVGKVGEEELRRREEESLRNLLAG